jgi:hypothetical protein
MAIAIIGNATIKCHMVRKDGNKEISQQHDEIVTSNIICDNEDDWEMRKMVAWIILEWGLDFL